MNKDKCVETLHWEEMEIPIEYLKQTTVHISGDDYVRLQQENKILKEKLKEITRIIEGSDNNK